MAEILEVSLLSPGGVYLPWVRFDLAMLREKGFAGQFMVSYLGQSSQTMDSDPGSPDTIPQPGNPVQPPNPVVGGSPGGERLMTVDQVTIFFATGQSKVSSLIESVPCPDGVPPEWPLSLEPARIHLPRARAAGGDEAASA